MVTLAYIRDDPKAPEHEPWIWNDLIGSQEPSFVFLMKGDLVLTLEETTLSAWPSQRVWVFRRLFRVTESEETGDAVLFEGELVDVLSPPGEPPRHSVSGYELIKTHNWLPEVDTFFKRLPLVVWTWLREERGLPLPFGPGPD